MKPALTLDATATPSNSSGEGSRMPLPEASELRRIDAESASMDVREWHRWEAFPGAHFWLLLSYRRECVNDEL